MTKANRASVFDRVYAQTCKPKRGQRARSLLGMTSADAKSCLRKLRPFSAYTKAQHVAAGDDLCRQYRATVRAHDAAIVDAGLRYGRSGPLISGGLRGHYPTKTKDRLRKLAHATGQAYDLMAAHYSLGGRPSRTRACR